MLALLLTGILIGCLPTLRRDKEENTQQNKLLVIWMQEGENDTAVFLKKAAAAYEKHTGDRVYLRYAAEDERLAASEKAEGTADVVMMAGGIPVAYRGYAILVPDEGVPAVTPAPTPALFIRPTPSAHSATPAPQTVQMPATVALPEVFAGKVPGGYVSLNPMQDLRDKKAGGALLTPSQIENWPGGYGIIAQGDFFLPIGAKALTEDGQKFLSFLRSEAGQSLLPGQKLFSWDKAMRLYSPDQPLLFQMENSR